MLNLLKQGCIMPSNIQTYSLVNIVKTRKAGKKTIKIRILCNKSKSTTSALQGIRVCLEADGVLYRDCPRLIPKVSLHYQVDKVYACFMIF